MRKNAEKNYSEAVSYICNVSKMLSVGSEPVISFLIEANPFDGVCFFCNFVRNKIYVTEVKVLGPVDW
jgi:hypothetical protein